MANPVAAHTFDFFKIYLSTRTGGAPGSGVWTAATTIFDGVLRPTFETGGTFSAGALGPTDPNSGIIVQAKNGLAFLGNGEPTVPLYITFAGQVGNPSSSDYWDTVQGALSYGTARHIVLANGNRVTVIKSTDDGATWARQDAGNGPTVLNADGSLAALQRVNDTLYVFTPTDQTDTNLAIFPFDLTASSNQWGASFAPIHIPDFGGFGPTSSGNWTNGLFKFPNGDFLVIYTTTLGVPVCRVWDSSGGGWGAALTLPGLQYANAVIDPAFDVVYILTYNSNSTPQYSLVHLSMFTKSTGLVTADIATIPGAAGDGVGHCSIQNGMIFIPKDDRSQNDNAVWVGTLPAPATLFQELLPIPAGESGVISLASLNGLGTGYVVGDTGFIDGGIVSQPYTVQAVGNNGIKTSGINAVGLGYVVGDQFTVNGGGVLAVGQVLAVDGFGGVTNYALLNLGQGYSVAAGVATTATSGVGTGFKINILTLFNGVTQLQLPNGVPPGAGYAVANNVTTTTGGAQPGVGVGLTINILAITGKTPSCAYMMFPNGYVLPNPLPPGPPAPVFPPSPAPWNQPQGGVLIYPVNYRELDTAAQIAAAAPIHNSYTGRLIATDHARKWTRWNIPAVGAALMYRQPGKVEPIFWFGGNAYKLDADLLTDDDLGLIVPYYTTYFFVTHDAEMGLTYVDATGERQPLGSGRKLLAYLKAYIAAQDAQAPGTCQIVITPFVDNLQNPWALIGLRTLVNKPAFDLEWPGGQAQGDRIALQFWSTPITGTDNGFSLQRLTAFLKRAQRLQIRGAN